MDGHDYKELYVVGFPATLKASTRLTFNANQPQHGLQWLAPRSSWLGLGSSILGSFQNQDLINGRTRNVGKVNITGGITYLTDNTDGWCELMPVPTSTGKIVYMSDINGSGDIYIMNQDGSNKIRLTTSSDNVNNYCSNHPEPTQNGKYIAYWSNDVDGVWRIWMMTANGMYKGVVVDGTVVNNRPWGYRPLKFNPAGTKLLFTGCTTPYNYYCETYNVYSLNLDTADTDGDLLKNYEEVIYGTDPSLKDTDGGGESDYSEVNAGRDPLNPADDIVVVRPVWGW